MRCFSALTQISGVNREGELRGLIPPAKQHLQRFGDTLVRAADVISIRAGLRYVEEVLYFT